MHDCNGAESADMARWQGRIEEGLSELEKKVDRAQSLYDQRFAGFPQEYASRNQHEALVNEVTNIKSDHVQRREHDSLAKRLDESAGARRTIVVVSSIVATILVVMVGLVFSRIPTTSQISGQIERETPTRQTEAQINGISDRIKAIELEEAKEHLTFPFKK